MLVVKVVADQLNWLLRVSPSVHVICNKNVAWEMETDQTHSCICQLFPRLFLIVLTSELYFPKLR